MRYPFEYQVLGIGAGSAVPAVELGTPIRVVRCNQKPLGASPGRSRVATRKYRVRISAAQLMIVSLGSASAPLLNTRYPILASGSSSSSGTRRR